MTSSNDTASVPWVHQTDIDDNSVLFKQETGTKGGREYLDRVRAARAVFQGSTSYDEQETIIWWLMQSSGSFYTQKWGHDDLWIKSDEDVVRARVRFALSNGSTLRCRATPQQLSSDRSDRSTLEESIARPEEASLCVIGEDLATKPALSNAGAGTSSQQSPPSPWVQRKDIGDDSVLVKHELETKGGLSFLQHIRKTQGLFQTPTSSEERDEMVHSVLQSVGSFYAPRFGHDDMWIKLDVSVVRSKIRSILSGDSIPLPEKKKPALVTPEQEPLLTLPRPRRLYPFEQNPQARRNATPVHRSCLDHHSILFGCESITLAGEEFLDIVQQRRPAFWRATHEKRFKIVDAVIRSSCMFYMKCSSIGEDLWVLASHSSICCKVAKELSKKEPKVTLRLGDLPLAPVRLEPALGAKTLHCSKLSKSSILCGLERSTAGGIAFLAMAERLHPEFKKAAHSHRRKLVDEVISSCGKFYMESSARDKEWIEISRFTLCAKIVNSLSGKRQSPKATIADALSNKKPPPTETARQSHVSQWMQGLPRVLLMQMQGSQKELKIREDAKKRKRFYPPPGPLAPKLGARPLHRSYLDHRSILCGCESITLGGEDFLVLIQELQADFCEGTRTQLQRLRIVNEVIRSSGTVFVKSPTAGGDMWVEASHISVCNRIVYLLSGHERVPCWRLNDLPLAVIPLEPKRGSKVIPSARLSQQAILCGRENTTAGGKAFQELVQQLRPRFVAGSTPEHRRQMVDTVIRSSGRFYMPLNSRQNVWAEVSLLSACSVVVKALSGDTVAAPFEKETERSTSADSTLSRRSLPLNDGDEASNVNNNLKQAVRGAVVDTVQPSKLSHSGLTRNEVSLSEGTDTGSRGSTSMKEPPTRNQSGVGQPTLTMLGSADASIGDCETRGDVHDRRTQKRSRQDTLVCVRERKSARRGKRSGDSTSPNAISDAFSAAGGADGSTGDCETSGKAAAVTLGNADTSISGCETRGKTHVGGTQKFSGEDAVVCVRGRNSARRGKRLGDRTSPNASGDTVCTAAAIMLGSAAASVGNREACAETRDRGKRKRSRQDTVVCVSGRMSACSGKPSKESTTPNASTAPAPVQLASARTQYTPCVADGDELGMYWWPCGEPSCQHWIKISQYAMGGHEIPLVLCSSSMQPAGAPKNMMIHDQVTWSKALQLRLTDMVRSRRAHYKRHHPNVLETNWPTAIQNAK
jgi:hypothetical protein